MNDDIQFLNKLLKSAENDTPAASAKARALATFGGTAPIAAASAASAVTGKALSIPMFLGWVAAVAAIGGVGAGIYAVSSTRTNSASVASSAPTAGGQRDSIIAVGPTVSGLGSPAAREESIPPRSAIAPERGLCQTVSLRDEKSAICSTAGEPMLLEIVNGCSAEAVDLYWVDYKCAEVFYRQLKAGETYLQSTFTTHPWRVRDHASHRLLKEIGVSGSSIIDGGTHEAAKKEVVIGTGDKAISTNENPRCSEAGWLSDLTVRNERGAALEIYWVDYDCKEIFKGRIEANDRRVQRTEEGHRWHVRDAETHDLIKDFAVNENPGAQRVYVSVP